MKHKKKKKIIIIIKQFVRISNVFQKKKKKPIVNCFWGQYV